jgi:transcriptional regulator with XRE-family HTH domain
MSTNSRTTRKEPHATIAEQLQKLRTENGHTVERFAEVCGVPPTTAREWLNGTGLPRMETAAKIVEAFGVSLDWLFFGDTKPRYPWEPGAWTPEHSRMFARDYFNAAAVQLLKEPERQANLERIYRLADRAGDAGLVDYDTHNAILAKVGEVAVSWLSDVHSRVRDVVDGELRTRIAKYITLNVPGAPPPK